MATTEELPRKHFLSARRAESAQTRPFSYYFLSVAERQKNVHQGEEEKKAADSEREGKKTGGLKEMDGKRRRGACWGHRVPAQRNSGKHP